MMECLARGGRKRGIVQEVWAMDEHRVGLLPFLRRVWAPRGKRPVYRVRPRYQWLYLYGFVHPSSGRSFWLLMPEVSIAAFNAALRAFAEFVQPSRSRFVSLVVDNAAWHTSSKVLLPPCCDLDFLPPCSPELQPAEHLWALSDLPLMNRCFDTLEQLEHTLIDRCRWLSEQLDLVRSTTHFHWWPKLC